MNSPTDDPQAQLRRGVYLLLIVVSAGMMLGRILAVDSVDAEALETLEDVVQRARSLDERLGVLGDYL